MVGLCQGALAVVEDWQLLKIEDSVEFEPVASTKPHTSDTRDYRYTQIYTTVLCSPSFTSHSYFTTNCCLGPSNAIVTICGHQNFRFYLFMTELCCD